MRIFNFINLLLIKSKALIFGLQFNEEKPFRILSPNQVQQSNNILYQALVTDDGINFKFPFMKGTLSYWEGEYVLIDPLVLDFCEDEDYPEEDKNYIKNIVNSIPYSISDLTDKGYIDAGD